jgi:DNA modification methylase
LHRRYIGIELEQKYCDHARRRLAAVTRYLAIPPARTTTGGTEQRTRPF